MGKLLGFAAVAVLFIYGGWARIGLSLLLSAINSKLFGPKIPGSGQGLAAQSVMVRSGIEYRKIVYGQAIVSGPVAYNNTQGTKNEYLWYLLALCEGEIDSFVSVWLDDSEIPVADIDWTAGSGGADGSGTGDVSTTAWLGENSTAALAIYFTLGNSAQVALGPLDSAFGDWTTSHRLRGIATVAVRCLYDEDTEGVWQAGAPQNIRAVVKGRKLYDPRLDSTRVIDSTTSPMTYGSGSHRVDDATTWEWSDTGALAIPDYLVNFMSADPETSIDWEAIATAADFDEASVAIDTASPQTTEQRFSCNGVLSLGATHKDNLDALLSCGDYKLAYSAGKWRLRASQWEASTVTFDEDDFAGDLEVQGSSDRKNRFNTVTGVFVDPDRNYQPTDFPPASVAAYITRDGRTLEHDLELPMTNSPTMAQRIALRMIEQGDNQLIAKGTLNARGVKCTVGDVVTLDMPSMKWSAGGNLLTYSNDLSHWTNTRCSSAQDVDLGPFGADDANAISEDGTAANNHFARLGFTAAANTVYTFSVWMKKSNRDWARLQINRFDGSAATAYFDLANGVIGTINENAVAAYMYSGGNGWYRCVIVGDSIDASPQSPTAVLIAIAEKDGDVTFDGLSQESILTFGAQVVAGHYEEPMYVETTGSVETTAAKTFRVIEWQRNGDGKFDVTLREDYSASYDDPAGSAYSAGNSAAPTIPSDVVPPPTGLAAISVTGGIKLTWTNPPSARYDFIQVFEGTDANWNATPGPQLVAQLRANTVTIPHPVSSPVLTYYYWVRAVKTPASYSDRYPNNSPDVTDVYASTDDGVASLIAAIGAYLSDLAIDPDDAEVGFKVDSDGDVYSYNNFGDAYASIGTWLLSGSNSDYECKLSGTGDTPAGSAIDTWLGCGSDRAWTLTQTTIPGGGKSFSGFIYWRDAATLEVLGSAPVYLAVDVDTSA